MHTTDQRVEFDLEKVTTSSQAVVINIPHQDLLYVNLLEIIEQLDCTVDSFLLY